MSLLSKIFCASFMVALATSATAQEAFPSKSIRMIIPSTPGGGTDFIGRTLSAKLGESAGWTLISDNRPGAAGTLGLLELSRAKAEGYDVAVGQTANVALAPWLMKLSFNPTQDLMPIALAVEAPMVMLVNVSSPYKTWADFLKAAKAPNAKPVSFATSGIGSVAHVAGVQLQDLSGFKLEHVPYKGSAPAIVDLMGGHVDMAGTSLASALPLLQSGKVRALAVTSLKRSAALPDVPALSESGYPNFNMVEWYGVFAPAGTPAAVADKLHAEINKVLERPEVRTAILAQGQEPKVLTRAAFAAMVKASSDTSHAIIQKAGIKLE
jgi:tripartite-type tricarboxylate transporter receptor subunit TctC